MNCHRIFIEDLPETASEDDIKSNFSQFGVVTGIEIKERKNVTFRNSSCFFAYVNLETNENKLQKCFQYFNENPWHGQHIKLKIAKESFLERLKREREANQEKTVKHERQDLIANVAIQSKESQNVLKPKCDNYERIEINHNDSKLKLNRIDKRKKKLSISSSSSSSSESEEEIPKKATLNIENSNNNIENGTSDIVIKNNKNVKLVNKKLKIEGFGKEPILKIEERNDKSRSLDKFRTQADHKRLDSLLEKKKAYSQQKNAIQLALSYSNINKSNKIIFNDDEVSEMEISKNYSFEESSNKMALFNEEDSESEEDQEKIFDMREKFQGKAGQKLMKLQSSFKNDKRFVMDEKFLENEEHCEKYDENNEDDLNLEEEKKKEFEILEEILGHEVKSKTKLDKEYTRAENGIKVMRRFDPAHPDHVKYEMKKDDKKSVSKKKKEAPINDKKVEDKEEPEVSKEIFYAVKDDLKKCLEEDKGFSLLSMFGTTEEKEESTDQNISIPIEKKKYSLDKNPFKYDSSDDEDQTEQLSEKEKNTSKTSNAIRAWSEPFFFQEDDFRLQEGVDFIQRIASAEKEDFVQIRRNLKEIARNKIRSNLHKNRPFKTKLGGNKKKKVRRINKALKR